MIKRRLVHFCFLVLIPFVFFAKIEAGTKQLRKDQIAYLQNGIERIIQATDPNVHVGIEIVSLKDGLRLYQKNAQNCFVPASLQKIFTAAAALDVLGVDFCFETKVLTDGPVRKNTLEGNLYLKGGGDPELSIKDLEELVLQLKAMQIREIKGNLIVDHSDFDDIAQGPGWMWDEGSDYWNSPLDALTVNHSCVNVWIEPADEVFKQPIVRIEPKTDYITILNLASMTEKPGTLSVNRHWESKENLIRIQGEMVLGSQPKQVKIAVEAPHLYTGHVFYELLKKNKISLKGGLVVQETPISAKELAVHRSSPLRMTLQNMLKNSDNLYANCLFKKMGQVRNGAPGTWQNAGSCVRTFLEKQVGLNIDEMVLLDGDGQSRYNLCTPRQIVDFLVFIHQRFAFSSEFMASLPISGIDGTLENRLCEECVKCKVRAKTGSMTGISSLAGYATSAGGEMFAFCIMINGFVKSSQNYKTQLEDQICNFLVKFAKD